MPDWRITALFALAGFASRAAGQPGVMSHFSRGGAGFYDFAFMSALAGSISGMARVEEIRALAWHTGAASRALLGLGVLLVAIAVPATAVLLLAPTDAPCAPHGLALASLHIALIGLIALELPIHAGVRSLLVVAALTVAPQLLGAPGQILLDASRWFRPSAFPDPLQAFGPILVLVLITCASTARSGTQRAPA